MEYTWDESKRNTNLRKHGIDFPTAIEVFHDDEHIEAVDDRHNYGEERLQTIGFAQPGLLFVVYTYRYDESTRRFILARRANKKGKSPL